MSTIQENLQIIADSTSAIKQAIIDKGGEIAGDITTWASAISGIATGGGSAEEEITFTGTLTWNMMNCTITGDLSARPSEATSASFCAAFRNSSGACPVANVSISVSIKNISLTCNFGEPSRGNEIPALFIVYLSGSETKIVPVKFIQQN